MSLSGSLARSNKTCNNSFRGDIVIRWRREVGSNLRSTSSLSVFAFATSDMPFPVLTAVEREEAMDNASSDLKFHCAEMAVPIEWQEVLFHLGFNNIALFAAMDRTEEGLCRFLKKDLELDENASIVQRKLQAILVCAWDEARKIQKRSQPLRRTVRQQVS